MRAKKKRTQRCVRFWNSKVESQGGENYSPTYGIKAITRARLIARLDARWKAAQLPLRLREKILFWFVQSFLSKPTSLKSTKVGRGHPSWVQKRQRFLRLRPSRLRGIRVQVLNGSENESVLLLFDRSIGKALIWGNYRPMSSKISGCLEETRFFD